MSHLNIAHIGGKEDQGGRRTNFFLSRATLLKAKIFPPTHNREIDKLFY